MPLYANGVLIPEDVANALTFNGADITDVWADGVQVWAQQLFAAQWSGDSTTLFNGQPWSSLMTSGSLFKFWLDGTSGGWLSAYTNGSFQNGSSWVASTGFNSGGATGTSANGITTVSVNAVSATQILFTIGSGFSGFSSSAYLGSTTELITSGGLVKLRSNNTTDGAWVSLT